MDTIVDGVGRLGTAANLRQQLRAAGMAHADTFTWERSAQQLLAAYRKTLSL